MVTTRLSGMGGFCGSGRSNLNRTHLSCSGGVGFQGSLRARSPVRSRKRRGSPRAAVPPARTKQQGPGLSPCYVAVLDARRRRRQRDGLDAPPRCREAASSTDVRHPQAPPPFVPIRYELEGSTTTPNGVRTRGASMAYEQAREELTLRVN